MTLTINTGDLIVWLIIGGLAGAITGMIVRRNRTGFGVLGNIVIGLIGALIGGFIFQALNISVSNLTLSFSLDAFIAAIVGSLILVLLLSFVRR
ncbi:MAG: GlsB/YeaQ/YmgE family stress response membrane protein [Anaerolineae bacterium]|nr:GlsB/YeaQ/YmgE family stress response membrane protein [Anaerolineae bacterium]